MVRKYVQNCVTCQQNKYEIVALPGTLQPLPQPKSLFTDSTIDFIEGLPKSQGKTVTMVVVDRLTKYAHFIGLSHPYTAKNMAQSFFR